MARIAVFPGTFDPITLGHVDVVRRAAGLFGRIVIAVSEAQHKKTCFSLEARVGLAQDATKHIASVSVLPFAGLLVDFCREQGAVAVVRGIRNMVDFDYEAQMAAMNRKLQPELETVFLLPDAPLQCISSSLVREVHKLGGDVSQMVSPGVLTALQSARAVARKD